VNAVVAEVSVERRLIPVPVQQPAKLAQVRSELLRRDRRVVPSFPARRRAGDIRGGAWTRLAQLPLRVSAAE
jgi:hypothetical protein